MDDVSLSNTFLPNPAVDKETEMMITAIENLTSRALKETGQQWESIEPNIVQNISNESNVDCPYGSMPPHDTTTDKIGLEINVPYNIDESMKYNSIQHSNSSSGNSSASFLMGNSESENNKNIHGGGAIEQHFHYPEINATNLSSSEEENNTTVIRNISYSNDDIKSKTPQQIDNNAADETLDTHICGRNNNNKDTETERQYGQTYLKRNSRIET